MSEQASLAFCNAVSRLGMKKAKELYNITGEKKEIVKKRKSKKKDKPVVEGWSPDN